MFTLSFGCLPSECKLIPEQVVCAHLLLKRPASLDVYARMLTASGGRIVQTVADLPPNPSLVIDALSDSPTEDASAASFKPKQQQQQQRKALAGEGDAVLYANSNAAPTLSIDGPSFLDFTSG